MMSLVAIPNPPGRAAEEVVGGRESSGPAGVRTYEVAASELPALAERAEKARWRFATLVADTASADEPVRLDLCFQAPGEERPVVLRTRAAPGVPSIARTFPGASWAEREVRDLFGVQFSGSPDDRPLVHHEDWPQGVCPLRPGERFEVPVERKPGEFPYPRVDGEGVMESRVGPIHAGIIEPGHFRFSAIGEMVVSLEARLFYVHRGVEQRAVGMAPSAALVLAERVSGTSAVGHGLAAARAIEAALGVEVPPAHAALRCLLLELERFYNHVGDLGNLCAGSAMAGLLAEGLLLKERLWEMCGRLTGSRQLRGLVGIGGVRREPTRAALDAALLVVRQTLEDLECFAVKYFGSASNVERLESTGVLLEEHARKMSTVGPVARASGVPTDSRLDFRPGALEQEAYRDLTARTETAGDVLARAHLRLVEARDSARLCETLVALISKAGSAQRGTPTRDHGEGFGWAEGPRGEIVTYARLERGRLARFKVRSPSRMNWPAIALAIPGNIVPDFPLINKSFNLSYAGCDL